MLLYNLQLSIGYSMEHAFMDKIVTFSLMMSHSTEKWKLIESKKATISMIEICSIMTATNIIL